MYDFWYKNWLFFMIETEWKRGWNHRWTLVKRREIELIFDLFCTKYCIVFVAEHEWKRVRSYHVVIAKWCKIYIVLTIIFAFFCYCFDYNLCVFCTSYVPFLVILENIIGHTYPKLTIFGHNLYHFWVLKVSYVPFLVILETIIGHPYPKYGYYTHHKMQNLCIM